MATFSAVKDPDAVLDFTIDWSAWLATGETIATSAWTVATGMTEESDTNTTTTATVWVSGGTAGTKYDLTNTIVTSAGRTDERTIAVRVVER